MKKILILTSALAALSFISCSEKLVPELPEAGEYITVTTQVAPQSKAGYEGTSVLPSQFRITIDQEGTDKDYDKIMVREGSSNKYLFQGNEQLKWAGSDHSSVRIRAITTSGNYNNGVMTVNTDQSTADAVLASDLLGAKTGDGVEISGSNVIVHFNHLMSKLYVKYNTNNVTVNSVKVNNICISGHYNYDNMSHGQTGSTGSITMLHNSSEDTAEAIFFPFTPSGNNLKLVVNVTRSGYQQTQDLECPISLDKIGGSFTGGKRYVMNVTITNSRIDGAEVTVMDWVPDFNSIQIPGENVLWVGTSIPAGNAALNYPAEVDRAMTCKVTNVAVGGSLVCPQIDNSWITADHYTAYNDAVALTLKLMGGGLSQTKAEIRSLYRDRLLSVSNRNTTWADQVVADMQSLSYESLIIPYIDGTISSQDGGNCTTVILDHGFNDLGNMIYIAGVFSTPGEHVRGYEYLRQMRDGEKTVEQYEQEILAHPAKPSIRASYIHAMAKVIRAIQDVANKRNINIRIIIGNYFALYSPYVARLYQAQHNREYLYDLSKTNNGTYKFVRRKDNRGDDVKNPAFKQFPDYATFSNLLAYYNEALAGIYDLDIVNVYEHITIPENMFWGGTQDYIYAEPIVDTNGNITGYNYLPVYDEDGSTPVDFDTAFNPIVRVDQSKFCPDGVHPSNPAAVGAIAEIYIRELDGVIGSKN